MCPQCAIQRIQCRVCNYLQCNTKVGDGSFGSGGGLIEERVTKSRLSDLIRILQVMYIIISTRSGIFTEKFQTFFPSVHSCHSNGEFISNNISG